MINAHHASSRTVDYSADMWPTAVTSTSVDSDQERAPPPLPTPVVFPHVKIADPRSEEDFKKSPPKLQKTYSYIQKPSDVRREHLNCLNYSFHEDVPLEELLPASEDGTSYLPPKTWTHLTLNVKNTKQARNSLDAFPQKYAVLSNGTKAPDYEMYNRFVLELHCDNEDALRATGRRKPRPHIPAPPLGHFRRFWVHLETMFAFWDDSLDNYYEVSAKEAEKAQDAKGFRRFSVALGHKDSPSPQQQAGKRYKGRRISTGARMPEHFRVDVLRNFVEPIVIQFGCRMQNPKRVPMLQINNLLVPVTQSATVWRIPQDKSLSRRGVMEGPLFGMQSRGEYNFLREDYVSYLDAAREVAGLMLIAEERARESKENIVPGAGKWYTSKPRWGGGPGGEFGEAEGNTDIHPHAATAANGHKRRPSLPSNSTTQKPSEEAIWKELKPGPSLWEPGHSYLAVGRNRMDQCDSVFMISCIIHHISILKLTVHPCYMDYVTDAKLPISGSPTPSWCNPKVQRSKWFDLFNPEDRTEAMRGIWGILAYSMRPGDGSSQDQLGRNRSDGHHASIFRRKSSLPTGLDKLRSHSVAF